MISVFNLEGTKHAISLARSTSFKKEILAVFIRYMDVLPLVSKIVT